MTPVLVNEMGEELMEHRIKLLVVDDEPFNLRAINRTFRESYDLVLAGSGAEALKLIESNDVDLALVDFAMPEMNGVELIRELKSKRPSLPCIIVTAWAEVDEVLEAQQTGLASAVIAKPWEKEEIEKWIRLATNLASMRQSVDDLKQWLRDTVVPKQENKS